MDPGLESLLDMPVGEPFGPEFVPLSFGHSAGFSLPPSSLDVSSRLGKLFSQRDHMEDSLSPVLKSCEEENCGSAFGGSTFSLESSQSLEDFTSACFAQGDFPWGEPALLLGASDLNPTDEEASAEVSPISTVPPTPLSPRSPLRGPVVFPSAVVKEVAHTLAFEAKKTEVKPRGGSVKNEKARAKRKRDSEQRLKEKHVKSEQQRRGRINEGLSQLKQLLPMGEQARYNQAQILADAVCFIGTLKQENKRHLSEIESLKSGGKVEELMEEVETLRKKLKQAESKVASLSRAH